MDEGQCPSQGGCGSESCQAVDFDLKAINSPKGEQKVLLHNSILVPGNEAIELRL